MQRLAVTFIIAFAVSAVAIERIAIEINRAVASIRAGNINNNDMISIYFLYEHILGGQYVDTNLFRVVYGIPEVFYQLLRGGQIDSVKCLIRLLRNAEENVPTQCIGKSRVGLPQALRKSSECLFSLYSVVLTVFFKVGKIQHMK